MINPFVHTIHSLYYVSYQCRLTVQGEFLTFLKLKYFYSRSLSHPACERGGGGERREKGGKGREKEKGSL